MSTGERFGSNQAEISRQPDREMSGAFVRTNHQGKSHDNRAIQDQGSGAVEIHHS